MRCVLISKRGLDAPLAAHSHGKMPGNKMILSNAIAVRHDQEHEEQALSAAV